MSYDPSLNPIGSATLTVPFLDPTTNTIQTQTYTDNSSINDGKYLLGVELGRVMKLLTTLIGTMQGVAVAQAGKINFFTQMQNANTDLMNSVHTFVSGNQDAYVSVTGDDDIDTDRQALNQSNTSYIQQIQANNNLISNAAKQQQTNLNQTQQSVTQMSNQLTSILTQLQTIASTITTG